VLNVVHKLLLLLMRSALKLVYQQHLTQQLVLLPWQLRMDVISQLQQVLMQLQPQQYRYHRICNWCDRHCNINTLPVFHKLSWYYSGRWYRTGLTAAGLTGGFTSAAVTVGAGVSSLNLSTAAGAQSALATIDSAIASVNSSRASLGAIQNRFTSAVNSLQTSQENLASARSRIQDADFASETANMTRSQVLQQAGTAILAQANSAPNGVLALLR
jgi:exonuclease VII small subunit